MRHTQQPSKNQKYKVFVIFVDRTKYVHDIRADGRLEVICVMSAYLEHCLQTKQIRKICVFPRKSLSTDPQKITNSRLKKFHKIYSEHKPQNKYRIFVPRFIQWINICSSLWYRIHRSALHQPKTDVVDHGIHNIRKMPMSVSVLSCMEQILDCGTYQN